MTARLTIDELLDRREAAMLRRDEKAYAAMERREAKAGQMIGELNSGKFYVYPVGGKYREGSRSELVSFLMRTGRA